MRLVVVDASAVGGGPVTRAVECAASEARRCGVEVTTVRLYSIFTSCCAACGDCRPTSRCARRHRAIEEASVLLSGAEVLLVGVCSSASQRDPRAEALLRRLVGSFAGVYDSRHGEGDRDAAAVRKRAGLVSSAHPLLSIAALLGVLPYGLAGVWRVLDRAGVEVVGTASVARRWSGPAAWDLTRERALRLGRLLAMRPDGRPALRPLPDGGRILHAPARPRVA
ncbi:MAG: hypothetical protein Q7W16_00905 [Coriobacteriia bacterium]|nr:hypothetical protein [Coriobacteriia bacterium]